MKDYPEDLAKNPTLFPLPGLPDPPSQFTSQGFAKPLRKKKPLTREQYEAQGGDAD